jgi:hypothetical protein
MKRLHLIPTLVYVLIAASTITAGFTLWQHLDTLSYKIVTLFISLIILSNCLAKLFMLHVFKQEP